MERKCLNNKTIIRRIRRIEAELSLNQKEGVVIIWSFGPDDEPHGKYGYRKFHVYTGLKEACTEEEEFKLLREEYDNVPLEARKNVPYWSSFQKFLEHQRCKCPVHRADVDFRAAEIKNMLRQCDEVIEKAAREHVKTRELELTDQKS